MEKLAGFCERTAGFYTKRSGQFYFQILEIKLKRKTSLCNKSCVAFAQEYLSRTFFNEFGVYKDNLLTQTKENYLAASRLNGCQYIVRWL